MSDNGVTISTYVVYAVHPNGSVRSTQLIATAEGAAISRTRGTLLHSERDAQWLHGYFEVAATYPGERDNINPKPEATDEAVIAWLGRADENEALQKWAAIEAGQ